MSDERVRAFPGGVTLHHGDCLEVLRTLPEASVDSIVTDPPYGLGFMGREWDSLPPGLPWAQECLRVLKPGGHLLAFGGTRTWHRLAVAVEDAGFEMRDSIAWLHAQGFPKSMNVGAAPLFCTCPAVPYSHGRDDVRGVRDDVLYLAEDAAPGSGADLLAPVQRGAPGPGVGAARAQGVGGSEDAHASVRSGEPRMEGGRHAQAAEGQLHGREVRPLPAGVPADGEVGRLHLGAPAGDGAMGGPTADPLGVREPRQPRPVGQSAGEPGPLADERGPQARRGWPLCGGCGKQRAVGLGTALKPAFEPIVVARKPLTGTVAANVLTHGTGALNIDGCRTPGVVPQVTQGAEDRIYGGGKGLRTEPTQSQPHDGGRWPANVVLDESQAVELDRQSGTLTSGLYLPEHADNGKTAGTLGAMTGRERTAPTYGDTGGASRFFPTFRYQAKAPTKERPKVDGVAHPTVKPLALMRWLVRLVTPPGGTVLDPFAGSGTTGQAAVEEGFGCILIEREADYLPLICARLIQREPAASEPEPEPGVAPVKVDLLAEWR